MDQWPMCADDLGHMAGRDLVTTLHLPAGEQGADALPPRAEPLGGPVRLPSAVVLLDLYRSMVIGRRFDAQATALTKQGRLAVYPSSRGQEACEIGATLALREQDWLFPIYRASVAIVTRSVDPVEVLALLRGAWHCGYDPYEHRVAPQCTPLATNTLHAVGLAHAARLKGAEPVAAGMLWDG